MRVVIVFYILYVVLIAGLYSVPKKIIYIPSLFVTLIAVLGIEFLRLGIQNCVYIIFISAIATAYVRLGKDIYDNYEKECSRSIDSKMRIYDFLYSENKELIARKNFLDDKSFIIGQVYEVTKAMSGMLKEAEILKIFSAFLSEKLHFKNCYVVLFDMGIDTNGVKKFYKITKGKNEPENVAFKDIEEWHGHLMESVKSKEGLKEILRGDANYIRLNIDQNILRLNVLPLSIEEETFGFIAIEDLPNVEYEIFSILATQVTMELKKSVFYENVEKFSVTDGLTEVFLRRYFLDRLDEEIMRAERLNLQFAVLMLDLDMFKKCNDKYGHMVGDVVLKEVAKIIKQNIREIDLVSRYGGEEFMVLLPYATKETAFGVAERIRKAVQAEIITAYDEHVSVTISIGISIYPDNTADKNTLLNYADEAMYRSKESGRNRVTLFVNS